MASDVSSGCTEVNELFNDEKEEGEISLEDVSSSEEGQLYPSRTYREQCQHCLSIQCCSTWCRSLTVNKVNSSKRDGGVQGKENRGNRHYDKEPAGESNVQVKHVGLYSTLQEKNDDEGQNDLVPISSDSDMELVGLESMKKEKKHRKLHKKRRKKSPLPSDLSLAISIKESIHRLESGLFKKDAGLKSSHSRTRYSPDKKSILSSQQRRHSRLSPVNNIRSRRLRSPLRRKLSPPLRQRKLPPQTMPDSTNEDLELPPESPSSRGSVDKLLKKVRNLEPFSSRSKEKGSSLKDKLSNIINNDKKDSSAEEISCKENKPMDTDAVKKESSKIEIKNKESNKKKEKHKETEKEVEKEKEKEKVKEKDREKDKAKKEKEKSKELEKEKTKEKEKVKEKEREKDKSKVREKKAKEKDKVKEKVKEKEKKKIKEKEKEKNKEKEKIKMKDEHKFFEENEKDDLIVFQQMALDIKDNKSTLLSPEQIKIEPFDHDDENMQENNFFKMPNFCMDDNDEDLQLRMIALRSAVIKKHRTRMQYGLKKKKTKNSLQKEQQATVPRMESPFTASFIDDFPLLAEICSPSSPSSKKDSLSVEDMVLDSDMELTAISEDESPYSPSDDIAELAGSSLYTPSKPTETPCPKRSNDKHPTNDLEGNFLDFTNQEFCPYSPTDITIYDPELPGVHYSNDPSPVVTLTPPQIQHAQPLHATSPLQPAPPLQPPPLPPLSMFAAPVPVPEPMVLGCPPNMLNPFVDPTLANFPVNPMLLQPPQIFTPFSSMAPSAPSLPTPTSQMDNFGETDLDGSPLVPIEKDGQQQQQHWRLLNEPLYLQDLKPLGESQINKMPMLATPNLVPTAVLKSNKQLQKPPLRKLPVIDNSLFRNAEMTPVALESDINKPCAMFKPMKLQPALKVIPLQPAAVFNSTIEEPDSPGASQLNGQDAASSVVRAKKSVIPSPSENRKMRKRERRAAKRANLRERMRTVKTVTAVSKIEEPKKSNDKKCSGSVEDDEDFLREILLASMAKKVKEHSDKTAEQATAATDADTVETPKTDASSVNATKQFTKLKSNASATYLSQFTTSSMEIASSTNSLESTATSSSTAAKTTTTNNLKRPLLIMEDTQPLSKFARKTLSAKVVNKARRSLNLLQCKMGQENNSTSSETHLKDSKDGSPSQRSISPNVANMKSDRLIINLNEDTESESEKDEAQLSPSKKRPQLQIPETEFEMCLNQFLKCAREQHEMAAASTTTAATSTTPETVDETVVLAVETTVSESAAKTTVSESAAKATTSSAKAEKATIISTVTPTASISTTSPSKTTDTAVVTTSPTGQSTSKTVEANALTSKATHISTAISNASISITPSKLTMITTSPKTKTVITTVTKTNASTVPVKIGAGQVAATAKVTPNSILKNDSMSKIIKTSVKTATDGALTPTALKHLPPPQQEEYRRLKQQIYELERIKRLKAKESGASVPAVLNKPVKNAPSSTAAPSPLLRSPPSLTSLALASSTLKLGSKPVAIVSESPVQTVFTPSTAAVSLDKSPITTVSASPTTVVSKQPITTVSAPSEVAIFKLPVATSATLSAVTVSMKTTMNVATSLSTSVTDTKPVVATAAKSTAIATGLVSNPLSTVSKIAPKSQLVATINRMAKAGRDALLSKMSPIVLLTPTKIVHSTAGSVSLVKSVPNKTASFSNVATNRNLSTSNLKAATSSPRIISQSTEESPTKLLDKMNAALNNQRLQISAVAHKVSSLRILTKEQINHKPSPLQETTSSTSMLNMNLNRINKEPTSNNSSTSEIVNITTRESTNSSNSPSTVVNKELTNNNNNTFKVAIENPSTETLNNSSKASSSEASFKQTPSPNMPAPPDNSNTSLEDFRHEISDEVQSLADLSADDQRNLLWDTEERLISKRHLVLDDITEMSSNLRQWEIERDLQSILNSEVKKLREQLRMAEEKMQRQKEKLSSIQPKISSYHEKINAGRKECFRLSKICSGLGQQVVGPSYKVPIAGAELLNNRIREVAKHSQKLKSRESQSKGTLENNNSQKTDNSKHKNNPKLNNSTNLNSREVNSRENNVNVTGTSLPNNHDVNKNTNTSNVDIVKNEESTMVTKYDSRIVKEEVVTDESTTDEDVNDGDFNNDTTVESRETNSNNLFLNRENNLTNKSLNSANVSNTYLTDESLNSGDNNSKLSTFSISNAQSEKYFSSVNETLSRNHNNEMVLNINQTSSAVNEKTNAGSRLNSKISSRGNLNELASNKQSPAFDNESNIMDTNNLNLETNNIKNPHNEIINRNLLTTTYIDNNICNVDNLNKTSENSIEVSSQIENSINESNLEKNAPADLLFNSTSINDKSNKNLQNETVDTTSILNNIQHTQKNELCLESNSSNVNTIITNIKTEPEMEVDSDADATLQTSVPPVEDMEEFADSKLNEITKGANEENGNYQNEFPVVSAGSEYSTLLEEINLLEIANAVEVPSTLTRYSQMFKKRKRTYKPFKKLENVKDDSKKKKVPQPYESILKHLNAPRNSKIDGILCPYELMGTCYDGDCQYIHQSTSHC